MPDQAEIAKLPEFNMNCLDCGGMVTVINADSQFVESGLQKPTYGKVMRVCRCWPKSLPQARWCVAVLRGEV